MQFKQLQKRLLSHIWKKQSRTGPKVLMFEPLPMPTKTRNMMFPGEDKKKLSTCEEEANKLVKIILSEIGLILKHMDYFQP